jgi:hypothetical protein
MHKAKVWLVAFPLTLKILLNKLTLVKTRRSESHLIQQYINLMKINVEIISESTKQNVSEINLTY